MGILEQCVILARFAKCHIPPTAGPHVLLGELAVAFAFAVAVAFACAPRYAT